MQHYSSNTIIKALWLNGLVYPGAGHILLKRYKSAAIFSIIFTIVLVIFFWEIVSEIQPLVDKVMAGKLALTQQAMANEMSVNPIYLDIALMKKVLLMMLFTWLGSLLDCCRFFKRESKQ